MDLSKSFEFFDPQKCGHRIHIIGCGAVGSTVAELLVRAGLTKISLYDSDIVEPHNIANQIYTEQDINIKKTYALQSNLLRINPDLSNGIELHENWSPSTLLFGYVFLCVDNIELRSEIVTSNRFNPSIKAFFDFRIRLTDAQHYAADTSIPKQVDQFLGTMQFSQEESDKETPVSACNLPLSVAPTVRVICSLGVANFMNYITRNLLKTMVLSDPFNYTLITF